MAKVFIWDRTAKRTVEVKAACEFTMHGERFAAHRDIGLVDQWRVSHVQTGAAVGPAQLSRAAALAMAKVRLEHMTTETVRAAIEKFHVSLKAEIERAQEEERKAQQKREERKAKAAAKREPKPKGRLFLCPETGATVWEPAKK